MPDISQACFKEATEDTQNWEILNQIEVSGDQITEAITNLQGFQIPTYDEMDLTYYGTTNNVATVVYSNGGTPVATLTLTYAVQPPTTDDENLVNVTLS